MNIVKRWFWPVLIALLIGISAILIVMSWDGLVHKWRKFEKVRHDSSLLATRGKLQEPYLIVNWPARKRDSNDQVNDAVTFRIPSEYVIEGTTLTDKDGIHRLAIMFELPGPQPPQERPWLIGKQESNEYKEFMKTWSGNFIVAIGRDQYFGYNYRKAGRQMVQEIGSHVRDTDFFGLERYSLKSCFDPKEMLKPEVITYLKLKESDDSSEANCRLDRRFVELISPPTVVRNDEGIFIRCVTTGCSMSFPIEGRGAKMAIPMKSLEKWPEYVATARKLISGFVVANEN